MGRARKDVYDLGPFDNVCRLFPLRDVVLFPHAILKLHIFEPRYRQMTEDALASGDNLITIVQLVAPATVKGLGSPPIEEMACLGRILHYQRLSDGRFNYLLLGLRRVRLHRELPSDKPYRLAEAELLEDEGPAGAEDPRRGALLARFRRLLESEHPLDPDVGALLDPTLPLGVLTDLIAHALSIPAAVKQRLLVETGVDHRSEQLAAILDQLLRHQVRVLPPDPEAFTPRFSVN